MVDVLTRREVERPQIVITGERIASVGRQRDPTPPAEGWAVRAMILR
jgi:hypothetical protein